MDLIFGEKSFRNEIIWAYDTPSIAKNFFPRKTDHIFFYTKSKKYNFNSHDKSIRIPYKRGSKLDGKGWGVGSQYSDDEIQLGKLVPNWWIEITPVQRLLKENVKYPTQNR